MRNILKALTLLILISGCRPENEKTFTILSGEIKNSKDSLLILKNSLSGSTDTIQLINQKFRDTLILPESYYFLVNGNTQIELYLKSGMDLKLSFDKKDVINSLVYEGKGHIENNYLAAKAILESQFDTDYSKINEKYFLSQTDSIHQTYLANFINTKNLEENFSFLEKNAINIQNAMRLSNFERKKQMMGNNPDFKVSKKYPNPYVNIDLNNEQLMNIHLYPYLMNSYISSLVENSENFSYETSDFFLLYQKELSKSNINSKIRDRIGFDNSDYGFQYTKDIEKYYQEYMNYVQIDEYKTKFQKRYNTIKSEKGNPSPNFKFIGIDNNWYTLDDFKGKYIYIDLWASWCSPCIVQIPYLQKLEEKYSEKINFVSIARGDRKSNWEKMISAKNLGGIQLFAENKEADFFKFYNVDGIPRFILLDKEANIIESFAKQPSESSLEEQFKNLE